MRSALQLWRKLRHLAASRARGREMAEEIRFHLESGAEELADEGLSRQEALRRARREFGGTARIGEEVRAAWQISWLIYLWADLRHASRSYARNPGFEGGGDVPGAWLWRQHGHLQSGKFLPDEPSVSPRCLHAGAIPCGRGQPHPRYSLRFSEEAAAVRRHGRGCRRSCGQLEQRGRNTPDRRVPGL